MSFTSSQYPQIDDYILNDLRIEPEDYDSFDDFLNAIEAEFDKNISSGVFDSANSIWQSREGLEELKEKQQEELQRQLDDFEKEQKPKPKPKEKPKEVKLTKTQETDIKNVIQNEDLTKREVSIRTLEIVNKPFSLKQFYDETGMIQSTARRELGQAVKRGELKRVSRGVYRRL
tara:strand:+ start:15 stop:536 length:522 start_codon:yes stop_codon:yes gene_type:complete